MKDKSLVKVSMPTIRRLPQYLQVVKKYHNMREETISSTVIAKELGLEAIQVRKDIEVLGIKGQPRVGYKLIELIAAIESFLNWDNDNEAFIIGVGHLGRALMGYKGFENYGLKIIAGFDIDPLWIGSQINGVEVFHIDKLSELARRMNIHIGVLAVPQKAAQKVAEYMVECGIVGIWNFTPVTLTLPEDVIEEKVDLAASLAVLSRRTSKLLKQKAIELEQ